MPYVDRWDTKNVLKRERNRKSHLRVRGLMVKGMNVALLSRMKALPSIH